MTKRPAKIPDLMALIRRLVAEGRYVQRRHVHQRKSERGIVLPGNPLRAPYWPA